MHRHVVRLIATAALGILAASAFCYQEDTHFEMTYVVCRLVGMTSTEALTVASVDQGLDDSSGTVANGGSGGMIPNVPEESLWHALDANGRMGASGVLSRKEMLFQNALSRKTTDQKLFMLGVSFYYQQDTWAHRHHLEHHSHTYDQFVTYNTPFGHTVDGHQPDRPHSILPARCYATRTLFDTRPSSSRKRFSVK